MLSGHKRILWRRNIAENFNWLSRVHHRRRSGWTSGGTHGERRSKGGSVSSGVAYGEECPLSSRPRGLGERRKLPQRGMGRSPGRTDFDVFLRP